MTLHLKIYQKYNRSKVEVETSDFTLQELNLQILLFIFLIPLEVQGHTVPHWKALSNSKNWTKSQVEALVSVRGVLKCANLLHKKGSVDFQMVTTVPSNALITMPIQNG